MGQVGAAPTSKNVDLDSVAARLSNSVERLTQLNTRATKLCERLYGAEPETDGGVSPGLPEARLYQLDGLANLIEIELTDLENRFATLAGL